MEKQIDFLTREITKYKNLYEYWKKAWSQSEIENKRLRETIAKLLEK